MPTGRLARVANPVNAKRDIGLRRTVMSHEPIKKTNGMAIGDTNANSLMPDHAAFFVYGPRFAIGASWAAIGTTTSDIFHT